MKDQYTKERYTMQELTAILNCNINTLRAWLEDAGFTVSIGKHDRRERLITREQAEHIALEHERELRPLPEKLPKTLMEAHKRILQLQQENAALQMRLIRLEHAQRVYIEPETSEKDTLPEGWDSLDGFCRRHGISTSTVYKAISHHLLPEVHRGSYKRGRSTILNAVDEEMQKAILARYGKRDRGS